MCMWPTNHSLGDEMGGGGSQGTPSASAYSYHSCLCFEKLYLCVDLLVLDLHIVLKRLDICVSSILEGIKKVFISFNVSEAILQLLWEFLIQEPTPHFQVLIVYFFQDPRYDIWDVFPFLRRKVDLL